MSEPAPGAPRPDAVILCGGDASRLGGVDKPLQMLGRTPLIARVIKRLNPQADRILISANRNHAEYRKYSNHIVDDGDYAGCGPLAGLVGGLATARGNDLLCVPGDAPALPKDLLMRLSAARASTGSGIAFVDDGAGPQPLCCLLSTALLIDLRTYLDAGGRTPREWFAQQHAALADFSDAPPWIWSVNTPTEWRTAEQHLRTETAT